MRRRVHIAIFSLGSVLAFSAGCGGGGGGGGGGLQPPPLQPDFTIGLSASSLAITQGNSSAPISVSVTPLNGFSGTVQVALSGLPSGVTTNPVSPFSIPAGQSVSIIVGASASASTGQFNLSAQATSGSLSHTQPLALTIQAGVVLNLPRSTYLRNDSVAAADIPPGESRRRQIVYDPVGKRFFLANRAMNRVEVYSESNPALQSTINIPGAASVDLSSDGATLWVGTSLEQLLAVDTGSLQIKARYSIAGLTPIPGAVFNRPTEALALSSGKLALRLRQSANAQSLLALWDASSSSFTDLTSSAPGVFQNGLGPMARSGDRSRLLAASNDSSGEIVLLNSDGGIVAGPVSVGSGTISAVAASQDGSRFALLVSSGAAQHLVLCDASLSVLGNYSSTNATSLVFSSDGLSVYVAEALGNGRVVTALSSGSLQKLGQISDLAVQGISTAIEEAGASQLLWGRGNRGVGILDASSPGTLPTPAPNIASIPAALPAEGPSAGGTNISISGSNFPASAQIRFGSQSPVAATVQGSSLLQVASPASSTSGAMNLTIYFSNGWTAVVPEAFSYGPSIQSIIPSAGSKSGGETIYLIGHGFGTDTGSLTVKIGGQSVTVQKVESLPAFASSLSLDTTYPFPLERITLTTPSGTAGKADISLTSPSGTSSLPKSFQYVSSSQTYSHPGLYKFVLYDQSRQRVYLTATDHIDAFDLAAQAFRTPVNPPPNGPPPNAGLRGMALTPDNSQLIVADFGAQSVYLINPDGAPNNGSKVSVGGVAGYLNSGPSRVAATSAQTVFVGLSGEGGSSNACNNCLGQMNLTAFPPSYEPAPQPEVTSITGAPLLHADHKGDTVFLAFGSNPGGPVAGWSATAPNSFDVSTAKDFSVDLSAAADGTMFALRSSNTTELRDANLTLFSSPTSAELETVPHRVASPGTILHPTGALLYEPYFDGPPPSAPPATGIHSGIDIRDARSGRLRLRVPLPEPLAMLSTDIDGLHGTFLSVDENGQRLFALTTSGLTIVQLATVPLAVGTLAPASGPAAGGTSLTLRGSGFLSGTKVTLGGKSVTASLKDSNTLAFTTPALTPGPQQLILTNPDGDSVSLDAAFLAE